MDRRIKGILFDLGDTLIDFAHASMTEMFLQGARLGYEYLRDLGKPVPGFRKFHFRQLWAIRWNYIKSRVTGREFNSLDIMGRFASKWGYELTEKENLELAWRFYQPLCKVATVVPEAPETVKALKDKGLKIALVSNTFLPGEILDRHLDLVSMGDMFDTKVYSSQVEFRKPHPKIFQIALDAVGLQAAEAIFVGDSPSADIAGANRVGMITVLRDLPVKRKPKRIAPDHHIADMTELLQIVAQYE
jgi:HAD superfamily hydrolase (TIGR01509 family)